MEKEVRRKSKQKMSTKPRKLSQRVKIEIETDNY